jgi:hypothetical protein
MQATKHAAETGKRDKVEFNSHSTILLPRSKLNAISLSLFFSLQNIQT